MKNSIKSTAACMLLPLGVIMHVICHSNDAFADISELDGFDEAISTGSKEAVLDFVEAFPSSHLVADLFELLPPDVAAGICADLPDGVSSRASRACNSLQDVIALAPAAGESTTKERTEENSNTQAGVPDRGTLQHDGPGKQQEYPQFGVPGATEPTPALDSRQDGIAAKDAEGDTTGETSGDTADDGTETAEADDGVDAAEGDDEGTTYGKPSENEGGNPTSSRAGKNGDGASASSDGGSGQGSQR